MPVEPDVLVNIPATGALPSCSGMRASSSLIRRLNLVVPIDFRFHNSGSSLAL